MSAGRRNKRTKYEIEEDFGNMSEEEYLKMILEADIEVNRDDDKKLSARPIYIELSDEERKIVLKGLEKSWKMFTTEERFLNLDKKTRELIEVNHKSNINKIKERKPLTKEDIDILLDPLNNAFWQRKTPLEKRGWKIRAKIKKFWLESYGLFKNVKIDDNLRELHKIGDKWYYIDDRLLQISEADNPQKRIKFKNKAIMMLFMQSAIWREYISMLLDYQRKIMFLGFNAETGEEIDIETNAPEIEEAEAIIEILESLNQSFDGKMNVLCWCFKDIITYWKITLKRRKVSSETKWDHLPGEFLKERANLVIKIMTKEEKLMLRKDYPCIIKLLETPVKDWENDDVKWIEENLLFSERR